MQADEATVDQQWMAREISRHQAAQNFTRYAAGHCLLPLHLDSGLASIRSRAKYSAGLSERAPEVENDRIGREDFREQSSISGGLGAPFHNGTLCVKDL